jgi:hypothetical protein
MGGDLSTSAILMASLTSGAFLVRSWRVLRPLDRLLGSLETLLGWSWDGLGASWAPLGPTWRRPKRHMNAMFYKSDFKIEKGVPY